MLNRILNSLLISLLLPCWVFVALSGQHELHANATVDFAHEVVPILRTHCAACHAGDNRKGGFSFNTRVDLMKGSENGMVLEIGKSESSRLIEVVSSTVDGERMPPEGPRLSEKEVDVLRRWIDSGASWEEGFAFKPQAYEPPLKPRLPELPEARNGRNHSIDRIIDFELAKEGSNTPGPISDHAFARRVSLDLVGLLPEPEMLATFLKDKSSDRRAKLVDRLLADNQAYAEHWLTFWNDLLRNDYGGTGFITGGRKQISGWLYASLLSNKPYNVFVTELIASPNEESRGFIEGIKWRGEVSAGQTVEIQFAQSVSQSLLGINLKCASCHDSFVDRWKLDEAYGMAAIYATTDLQIHRCDKATGRTARAKWLFPEIGDIDPAASPNVRLQQLAELMTHPENGRFTRTMVNRLWHRMMGRGIVHPTDSMQAEPWSSDLLDWLASDFASNGYDLKHTLRAIANSEAYQSQAEILSPDADSRPYQFHGPRTKRLTAEQFVDMVWQLTEAAPKTMDATFPRGESSLHPKGTQTNPQADLPAEASVESVASPVSQPERMVRASLLKSDPMMRSLGRPNRDQIVSMRPNDVTTLEAMELANGSILSLTIARGAENLLKKKWESKSAFINWLYEYAYSRKPNVDELALADELLGNEMSNQGIEDLLWCVVMQPEFQWVR